MATTKQSSKVSVDITPKQGAAANDYGLLIDYEWCTGCHTCEMACQRELELEVGEFGITVFEFGPVQKDGGPWDWKFLPMPTDLCDLCVARTEEGRLPSCVHHCMANVMYYGTLEELSAKLAEKPNQVLYSLKKQQ